MYTCSDKAVNKCSNQIQEITVDKSLFMSHLLSPI